MGLITVSELEEATGVTITNIGRAQFVIDSISAYIESQTGQKFSPVIDQTVRCQADSYGIIEFADLDDVSAVKDAETGVTASYGWDRMNKIYGLCSYQVVDVTISYGWDEPPEDILGILITLCAEALGLPLGGDMQRKRVGDVEEQFSVTVTSSRVLVTPSGLMTEVFNSYLPAGKSWRLGPMNFSNSYQFPRP